MRIFKSTVITLGLLCAFSFCALAGDIKPGSVPGSLNYQGRLERDNAPITGPISLVFRIYNVLSGGNSAACGSTGASCRWTSSGGFVTAAQGIFSASITPPWEVLATGEPLYLEVQVESDVLSPREPLNSVAYAMVAKKLEDGAYVSVSTLTTAYQVLLATTTNARVGIGVGVSGTLTSKLVVNGDITLVNGGVIKYPDGSSQSSAFIGGAAGGIISSGNTTIVADSEDTGTGDIIFGIPNLLVAGERARLRNNGDFGIGTAAPKGKLDVNGALYVGSQGIYDRTGGSVTVSGLLVPGGNISGGYSEYMLLGQTDNVIAFVSGGAERMRIHSNGNVGVGLPNPVDNLHVAGDIASNTGVRGGRVAIGGYSTWTNLPNEVRAETGYHLLLQQTNSYNVGVGTNTPTEKLHVHGSIKADYGIIAATAAFSGPVSVNGNINVNGDLTVGAGLGNTVSLPETFITGNLHVTGGVGSDKGLPAYLTDNNHFSGGNTFTGLVTVSTDILISNRVGVGVMDFDFPASKYLQIGDSKDEFASDDAAAYLVAGNNANSKIYFYRGSAEAARIQTADGNNLALVVNNSTKSVVDGTYYRVQNSVVWISTGYATTPAIYVSSALGNVGLGTVVLGSGHRLTVEGNIRISTSSSPGQSYGLIFADGTTLNSASYGGSAAGISSNDNAVVQSDADLNSSGSVILRAGAVDGLVLNSGGNIGVGTLSPLSKFNIRGGDLVLGAPSLGSYASNGVEDLIIAGNIVVDGGIIQRSATPVLLTALTVSGDVLLSTAPAARTGIGATIPLLQRLQVGGDINIESGSGLRINNTATSAEYLRGNGTRFVSSVILDGDLPNTIVRTSRSISTTSPLAGGGDLSANRTFTLGGLSTLGTANYVVGVNSAAGAWEYKNIVGVANEIDVAHAAGQITIGIADPLSTTKGGTGANLSGSGGAHYIVRQSAAGAAFTSSLLADDDIPTIGTANKVAWTAVNKAGSSLANLETKSAGDLDSGTLPLARLSGITNNEIAAGAGIVDTKLASIGTANKVAWTAVNKAGSSLANLETKSAGDLDSGTLPLARLSGITNNEIAAGAGIVDTKLATIATSGKVSNTATTATSGNTPDTIVSRDGSGNFIAGTMTGNVTGSAGTLAATQAAGNSAITAINSANSGTVPVVRGGTGLSSAGGSGKALCWTATGTLGVCSNAVGSSGTCNCN